MSILVLNKSEKSRRIPGIKLHIWSSNFRILQSWSLKVITYLNQILNLNKLINPINLTQHLTRPNILPNPVHYPIHPKPYNPNPVHLFYYNPSNPQPPKSNKYKNTQILPPFTVHLLPPTIEIPSVPLKKLGTWNLRTWQGPREARIARVEGWQAVIGSDTSPI